jgi:hypothetical protein
LKRNLATVKAMIRLNLLLGLLLLHAVSLGNNRADAAQPARKQAANTTTTPSDSHAAKSRSFTFHYRFTMKGLAANNNLNGKKLRVWMPSPPSNEFQTTERLPATTPAELQENEEPQYGNRVLYFETAVPEDGVIKVDVPYHITRHEVRRADTPTTTESDAALNAAERDLYLNANRMVPTTGKPLKLLADVNVNVDKLSIARQLYDVVDDHVAYKKEGTGWGRGDSNWVCDSGYGNCTDFHSLFMSLARSQGLPARFEIGFSIPTDTKEGPIAGYHCWAWFHVDGRGWIPVDISEADKHPHMKEYYFGNLTADRVVFSVGRDLRLKPAASPQPINFFIYPHIEIDGEQLPMENVELQFAFEERRKAE